MQACFLCVARREAPLAREIHANLQHQAGYLAWLEDIDWEPQQDWWSAISSAIDRTDTFVLLLTNSALRSAAVMRQWEYALSRQKPVVVVPLERLDPNLTLLHFDVRLKGHTADEIVTSLRQWFEHQAGGKHNSPPINLLRKTLIPPTLLGIAHYCYGWLQILLAAVIVIAVIRVVPLAWVFVPDLSDQVADVLAVSDPETSTSAAPNVEIALLVLLVAALTLSALILLLTTPFLGWFAEGMERLETWRSLTYRCKSGQAKRIFISYMRQDFTQAHLLYQELRHVGQEAWLDVDIPSGADWQQEIFRAIDSSDVFCLLVSPWSLNSDPVRMEYERAVTSGLKILWILIDTIQHADAFYFFQDEAGILADPTQQVNRYHQLANQWQGIHWIDLRRHPRRITQSVLRWIEKPTARQGVLPVQTKFLPFIRRPRPFMVNLLGIALLIIGGLGLALCGLIAYEAVHAAWSGPLLISTWGKAAITFYFMAGLFLALMEYPVLVAGIRLMARRRLEGQKRQRELNVAGIAETVFILFAGILLMVRYINTLEGYSDFPIRIEALAWHIALACLLLLLKGPVTPLMNSTKTFQFWQTSYLGLFVDHDEQRQKYEKAVEEVNENTMSPDMNANAKTPIRPLATAADCVAIIYAPADRAFARYLETSLVKPPLRIERRLSEHSNAQAAVVVLSPYLLQDATALEMLELGEQRGLPLLFVHLEELPKSESKPIPPIIKKSNWIEGREDFAKTSQHLRRLLSGQQTPLEDKKPRSAPIRSTRSVAVLPDQVRYPLIGLTLSMVSKFLVIFFLLEVVWTGRTLPTHMLVVAILLYLYGNLQFYAILAMLRRGIGWEVLLGIQGLSAFLNWATYSTVQDIFLMNEFSGISLMGGAWRTILILGDLGSLAAIAFTPDIVRWLPRGRMFHGFGQYPRIAPLILPLLSIVFIIAILLPAQVQQRAEQELSAVGEASIGERYLVQMGEHEDFHAWVLDIPSGANLDIEVIGGSEQFIPFVHVLDQDGEIVARDQTGSSWPDTNRAVIEKAHFPAGGPYTLEVEARGHGDTLYELSISPSDIQTHHYPLMCSGTQSGKLDRDTPLNYWKLNVLRPMQIEVMYSFYHIQDFQVQLELRSNVEFISVVRESYGDEVIEIRDILTPGIYYVVVSNQDGCAECAAEYTLQAKCEVIPE